MTAVVAGAGFGKSALIMEALDANRAEPLGVDAWIGCQDEDVRLDKFFDAVFTAVRGEPPLDSPVDLDDAVNRIADAVWSHAPLPVSIVADDVHLLTEGSAGSVLLGALIRRLPANANFLLASRSVLPFPLARLTSTGDALLLSEDDLVMTQEELRQLATQRGAPGLDLTATGGWPALAELALHTGTATSPEPDDYLTDELLDDLPKSQVRALAVLTVAGPLTAGDLAVVAGDHDLDTAALVQLPLVDTAAGLIEAHALWSVATRFVDSEWLRLATVSAAEILRADGRTERAFALALAGTDLGLALGILGDLCWASIHTAADVDLAACVSALPPGLRNAPEAVLAATLDDDSSGWAANRDRLIATSIALADAGADDLELVALTRLGILGWQAADLSIADHLVPRVERLAGSGDPVAIAVVELGTALLAETAGDEQQMWAHIGAFEELAVPEPLHTMGHRYRASLDLHYGRPGDALRRLTALEDTTPTWLRDEVRVLAMWAAWIDGDVRAARRRADQLRLHAGDNPSGLLARSSVGLFDAWSPAPVDHGPTDADQRVAAAVMAAASARSLGMLVPSLVSSLEAAARLVAAGDEAAAGNVLTEAFGDPAVLGARARPAAIRGLALVWMLLPAWRDELRTLDSGDGPSAALRAARALGAARDAESRESSWSDEASIVLSDPALPTRLPALWVAELAARSVGAKPTDERLAIAQDAVDRLGPLAAHSLRLVASTATQRNVSSGANAILAGRTPVSEGNFTLRLLGPAEVNRDGEVVAHPDWRRERVRGLFAVIARHGTITRRAATDALWPDLEAQAGANNLRVTLSYLQKVLEPGRTRHETAYHVRGDGTTLRFAGRSSWTIDVEEFETTLDTAESDDRRGDSTAALGGYLAAIEWYRGPFLADVDVDAADESERERLCSRYVRALIRAGGLLLAVGRFDEAQRLAVAAQAGDPWSELAVCLQAEAYLAADDRAAALRTLRRAQDLTTELGLSPTPEVRRLERALAI